MVSRHVNQRLMLAAYLVAVLLGTLVHNLAFLGAGLAVVLLLAGHEFLRILRRASLSVFLFNLTVTMAYAVLANQRGDFSAHYVALVNMRVLLLTSMTLLFAARVNAFEALAFSRSLTYVLTIACGQITTLRRVLADFRLARKSRSIRAGGLRYRYRHAAGAGMLLLDKSMHTATEITHAMRSRGFFDD